VDEFLLQYWQKKPLLIKQAFPDIINPVSADELAGLACDDDVESRIVLEKDGAHPWELRSGPFTESDFAQLPQTHWTLLIQDIEKHLPELTTISAAFDFIPDWRMDDLMFSYAPIHGSVGPHVDAYDVFLLQTQGQRHWQINTRIDGSADMLDNTDLKILSYFESEEDWILEPGDMLYLPPGVAHYGVSLGDCVTCSIGFRAPSHQGLVQGYLNTVVEGIDKDKMYSDPELKPQRYPHELTSENIGALKHTVEQYLTLNDQSMHHWLGGALSEAKEQFQTDPLENPLSISAWTQQWQRSGILYRNTATKFLFINTASHISIYVNGEPFELPRGYTDQAEWLCSTLQISWDEWDSTPDNKPLQAILYQFYCNGYYYLA
jgi:50S ribosomal protein L16 3-hydroxylase